MDATNHSSPERHHGAHRLAPLLLCAILLVAAACSDSSGSGDSKTSSFNDDGDGLSATVEIEGWEILVDRSGYGMDHAESFHVTSNPHVADSDKDGLDDALEFEIRTDPQNPDTDGDYLTDYEEWHRWHTNPSSVDTDGDARGRWSSLTPNAVLFDGQELFTLHTSPTLADTDGDARWDCEEYDNPTFSPLIAELPDANFFVDGQVDVRLFVEYEEAVGSENEYGSSMKVVQTDTERSSSSTTHQAHAGFSADLDETSFGLHFESSYDFESRQTFETESRTEATRESSQYRKDTYESTEVASRGTIALPLRLENTGLSTFELNNLIVTVLRWSPGQDSGTGSFKAMATLRPPVDSFTLAPGERTPILEVSDQDINPAVVKEFLANPNAMVLQPAGFDLSNADGIDFDFLTENTFRRTALVEFDFGEEVDTHRVATDVWREQDANLAGVTMREVMEHILRTPYGTSEQGEPGVTKLDWVQSRSGVVYEEAGYPPPTDGKFWTVIGSRDEHIGDTLSFEDIVLMGGDELRFVLIQDLDGDDLFTLEEEFYGTDEEEEDTDGDELTDGEEVKIGWEVGDTGLPNSGEWVYSNPLLKDTDDDGLWDDDEKDENTDPTDPDTDGDDLADGVDPDPLVPAVTLYVDANRNGSTGLNWDDAFDDLDSAFLEAWSRWNDGDSATNVFQIWVARSTYSPTADTGFDVPPQVAIYGGFWGGETKRAQRDPNPQMNGTELARESGGGRVVQMRAAPENASILDGFTIRGGHGDYQGAGLCVLNGGATLRNLLFYDNESTSISLWGGALYLGPSDATSCLEDCVFLANVAHYGGGVYSEVRTLELLDCSFVLNRAVERGGAINAGRNLETTTARMTGCEFLGNELSAGGAAEGGAICLHRDTGAELDSCRLIGNRLHSDYNYGHGGAIHGGSIPLELTNCLLADNTADSGSAAFARGGAIYGYTVSIVNSTIANNAVLCQGGECGGVYCGYLSIRNSIFWGNNDPTSSTPWHRQLWSYYVPDVRFCCVQDGADMPGVANIWVDPMFIGASSDFHLAADSPCIDQGLNIVDCHPARPGRQPLPAEDLDGNPRIVDGSDAVTGAVVDMGCFEYQR